MRITARSEAIELGLKRYFDGKTCPSGHLSWKLVSNYTCVECLHQKHKVKRQIKRTKTKNDREEEQERLNGAHRFPPTTAKAKALGFNRYFTGLPCPKGHVSERYISGHTCVQCIRDASALLDAGKERARKAKYGRDIRIKNGDEIRRKERTRRASDTQFKLASILRSRVKAAIKGLVKSGSALVYLGCSVSEARSHIEAQFLPGMSWDNHAIDGWHIDHKMPISAFDLTDESQRLQAFHYTNLQPLWAHDNLKKSARLSSPMRCEVAEPHVHKRQTE